MHNISNHHRDFLLWLQQYVQLLFSIIFYRNSTDDIHNDDFASEFLLGKFPDKSIRTKVHKLVRSLHPFLQTNSSENILTALLDERYPKLCEVLTREEADGVLKFVSICENKEEGNYCFKPEPDKDRRNKVDL